MLTELSISPHAPFERPNSHALLRVLPSRADALADALELLRHPLVGGDDFVERVGDLAFDAEPVAGHPDREVADAHRLQRGKKLVKIEVCFAVDLRLGRRRNSSATGALGSEFLSTRHGVLQSAPGARSALLSKRMYGIEVAERRKQMRANSAQCRMPRGLPAF